MLECRQWMDTRMAEEKAVACPVQDTVSDDRNVPVIKIGDYLVFIASERVELSYQNRTAGVEVRHDIFFPGDDNRQSSDLSLDTQPPIF